jgi:hypothetical protein
VYGTHTQIRYNQAINYTYVQCFNKARDTKVQGLKFSDSINVSYHDKNDRSSSEDYLSQKS